MQAWIDVLGDQWEGLFDGTMIRTNIPVASDQSIRESVRNMRAYVKVECSHCTSKVEVELRAWKSYDHEGYWSLDTPMSVDVNHLMCDACLDRKLKGMERAREYESSVPPQWFDPDYAGEHWDEDY
jgi:hypothetical protein